MAVIAAAALLLVITGTYGIAGYFSAGSRLTSASNAIDVALAHRDAFDNAPTTLELDAPDARTMQSDALKFAQAWQAQMATIENDRKALAAADSGLRQQQWLTLVRRGNLDSESSRIAHARTALDAAGSIAADRVKEGKFEVALGTAVADFEGVLTDFDSKDFVAAVTAANKMQTDAASALGLTSDKQFPPEVHDYVAAIQALSKDFVDYLSALSKGDTAGAKALVTKANADVSTLQTFDLAAIGVKVDTYYQPLIDTYHSELSKAQ